MERKILHCDLNNFYASVECKDKPELQHKPVAVCGSVADRHGIILAKNEPAKRFGVSTGETVWQAQRKCPNLILLPPHMEQYVEISRKVREIYYRYTDQVEPFGIDECWLDVTGSLHLLGDERSIADQIREQVKTEEKITISVGISYNKIFAKLGSDLKKPDGVTEITKENYKNKVWSRPVYELLGVGRATARQLEQMGLITIGQLAAFPCELLKQKLGKNGEKLWQYANGYDTSPVAKMDACTPPKSMGNSSTCTQDLVTRDQVRRVILALSEEVCMRLRAENLMAGSLVLSLKDSELRVRELMGHLEYPTRSASVMASRAGELMDQYLPFPGRIRAVGVRACSLTDEWAYGQLSFYSNVEKLRRTEQLEAEVNRQRLRYGENIIRRGSLLLPNYLPQRLTHGEFKLPGANV